MELPPDCDRSIVEILAPLLPASPPYTLSDGVAYHRLEDGTQDTWHRASLVWDFPDGSRMAVGQVWREANIFSFHHEKDREVFAFGFGASTEETAQTLGEILTRYAQP
jgi:hypothetical protein